MFGICRVLSGKKAIKNDVNETKSIYEIRNVKSCEFLMNN